MDHVMVAREGRVRLFRVNGHGAEEVASLALTGPLPDDEELAAWSGALVLMTTPRATAAPVTRGRARAREIEAGAPAPKRKRAKHLSRGDGQRVVLSVLVDGGWHRARDFVEAGVPRGSITGVISSLESVAPCPIERRAVTPATRGRVASEYRITEAGRALLG